MCTGRYRIPQLNPSCHLLANEQRWHVLNHYRGLEPGPEHFGLVQRSELSMHKDLSVDALVSCCRCCWHLLHLLLAAVLRLHLH